jgi:putative PIN family toxin of toxin-antitoxin system
MGVLRIVIDTSVLVAGLRSRVGASNALLQLVALGRVRPLATPAMFLEYEDVLGRPEQRAVHGLNDEGIERILAGLASTIEPVEIHFAWRPQLHDASDEMVLEAAINGRADALVTFNTRDFVTAATTFGLRVKQPGEILNEVTS